MINFQNSVNSIIYTNNGSTSGYATRNGGVRVQLFYQPATGTNPPIPLDQSIFSGNLNGWEPLYTDSTYSTPAQATQISALGTGQFRGGGIVTGSDVLPSGQVWLQVVGWNGNYTSYTNLTGATNLPGFLVGSSSIFLQATGNGAEINPVATTGMNGFTLVTPNLWGNLPNPPVVVTSAASSVSGSTATLNGIVNPFGLPTQYFFNYGLTTNYGYSTATNSISNGISQPLTVSNSISGLLPNTTYHFRLVGMNSSTTNFAADLTFTTTTLNPIVTTLAATGVTASNATVNGAVNPNGQMTTAYFAYGLTTNYGNVGPITSIPATNGTTAISNLLAGSQGTPAGSNWIQSSAPGAEWYFIASSTNGSLMAAVVRGGGIWTSLDHGSTWTQTSAPSNFWNSVALSGDGTHLAAVVNGGGIWTSTNSGSTWIQTGAPLTNWWTIASSADGIHLAAVISGGGIWTSGDSGVTWTHTSAPAGGWLTIASSALGNQLVAALSGGGGIWISTNSGASWTQTSAPASNWYCVSSSGDGTHLAAVINGGGIWTSSNSGNTWFQASNSGNSWFYISSSLDGTHLAAVLYSGGIWISTDSGTTWTQSGAPTKIWVSSVWSSTDGTQLAAVENGGGIWTSTGTNPSLTPGTTYHFELVAANSAGTNFGGDMTFTTSPLAPTVTTLAATHITASNAILSGTVNPNGATTTVYFQYGLTTNYGTISPTNSLVATNGNFSISNLVTDLAPGTIYHYQLVGINIAGITLGAHQTFTTPAAQPVVTTLAATSITSSSATLNGTVNPNGAAGTAYFEYGLTTNYGSIGPISLLPATNGNIVIPGLAVGSIGSSVAGTNWTQTSAFSTSNWRSLSTSTDGKRLAGVVNGGGIWTSTNSGGIWTQTSAPSEQWVSIASSGDGTRLAAAGIAGTGIWTSPDGGLTWNHTTAPSASWYSIASSTNGTYLAAAANNGGVWTSTNGGSTWTQSSAPVQQWITISSSADGSHLAVLGSGSGIWLSSDSGATWTQSSAPIRNWYSVASSADGTHLAALINASGGIWTSSDSGATWTQSSAPSASWFYIASSADGTLLAATVYGGGI